MTDRWADWIRTRRTGGDAEYEQQMLAELANVRDRVLDNKKVNLVYEAIQPETDPMVDFDERDLLTLAENAGFFPINLEYRADIEPPEARRWETFVHMSGNPKVPTLAEAMGEALTAEEQERLVSVFRPAVEEARGTWRMGKSYLWAGKP